MQHSGRNGHSSSGSHTASSPLIAALAVPPQSALEAAELGSQDPHDVRPGRHCCIYPALTSPTWLFCFAGEQMTQAVQA